MKRLQNSVPVIFTFVLLFAFVLRSGAASAASVSEKVVLTNLDRPWAVVAGPDGNVWITEKSGQIKIFTPTFKPLSTLKHLPDLVVYGEGGLLDLAFHPKFKTTGWIYLAYTVADPIGHHTQINRFKYHDGVLDDHKVIFDGASRFIRSVTECMILNMVPRSTMRPAAATRSTKFFAGRITAGRSTTINRMHRDLRHHFSSTLRRLHFPESRSTRGPRFRAGRTIFSSLACEVSSCCAFASMQKEKSSNRRNC